MFDIGEWQGERFLTMEFVDGTTLNNVVSREAPDANRLPLLRTIELLLPVCAGLGAAHTAGVLHRDLKPDEADTERNAPDIVPNNPRSDCSPTRIFAERCLSAARPVLGAPAPRQ